MQNRTKPYKNDLFEAIEFQEIEEKASESLEFGAQSHLPARVIEWEIPNLGETAKKEARKFRIWPAAVWIGQAIGNVLIVSISFVGQLVWFFVLVLLHVLSGIFMAIENLYMSAGQRHGQRQGNRQRQDIDWRDVPTGWDAKGQKYVRKIEQRYSKGQQSGHTNNVNINVNITNH